MLPSVLPAAEVATGIAPPRSNSLYRTSAVVQLYARLVYFLIILALASRTKQPLRAISLGVPFALQIRLQPPVCLYFRCICIFQLLYNVAAKVLQGLLLPSSVKVASSSSPLGTRHRYRYMHAKSHGCTSIFRCLTESGALVRFGHLSLTQDCHNSGFRYKADGF